MAISDKPNHWLVRPRTIRRLWIVFGMVLVLTVVLQQIAPVKGYFGVDGWFGFGALFGFFACLAMVLIAKVLGWFLKRGERFYDG